MASKKIPIEIDLDTRSAQRAAKDLNKELQSTEGGLEDVESAGKSLARAIQAQADDMISEIDATRRAVDKLEEALGPGFNGDPTAVVADLKKVGLTAQEIEADADELAAALRRAGDVKVHAQDMGFNDVDEVLGKTTDNSRTASTAIGGIGNSISEMPGVGSLGPVAESFGMLAENALEGEANVAGLVGAAAGLVAVGLTVKAIQGHFQKIADAKAWRKEQVEGYVDALKDTNTAVDAVVQKLESAGELSLQFNDWLKIDDVLPAFNAVGVSAQNFAEIVAGGEPKLQAWVSTMEAAGVPAEKYGVVVLAARQEIKFLADAQDAAAASAKFFGSSTEDATVASRDFNAEVDKGREAHERSKAAIDARREALEAATMAEMAAVNSDLAYRNQMAQTTETLNTYGDVVDDATTETDEYADAQRDAEGAVLAQADAALRLAEDQAAARGETLTAKEKTAIYVEELERLAGFMTGPAKDAILGHIATLQGIPKSVDTSLNIITSTSGRISHTPSVHGASGGIVNRPTVALIGEAGPEAVVPLNRTPGNSPLPGMGGNTYNITVQGLTGPQVADELVNKIKEYERRNGGLPW